MSEWAATGCLIREHLESCGDFLSFSKEPGEEIADAAEVKGSEDLQAGTHFNGTQLICMLEPTWAQAFLQHFFKANTWIETWLSFRDAHRTSKKQCFSSKVWTWSNMLRFVFGGSSRRASDTVGAGTSTRSHGPAAASSGVSSQGSKRVQAVHSRHGERMGASGNRLLPCQVQSRQCQALEMEFLGPRPAVWDHTWTALCHRARWSTMCPMCPVSHKRWLAAIQFFYRDSFAHFVKIACRRGARRLAWTSGKSWWGCKMNVLNWYLDTEQSKAYLPQFCSLVFNISKYQIVFMIHALSDPDIALGKIAPFGMCFWILR